MLIVAIPLMAMFELLYGALGCVESRRGLQYRVMYSNCWIVYVGLYVVVQLDLNYSMDGGKELEVDGENSLDWSI